MRGFFCCSGKLCVALKLSKIPSVILAKKAVVALRNNTVFPFFPWIFTAQYQ